MREGIDEKGTVSISDLLHRAGAEAFGPAILVLALLSMVPYASMFTGAGLMVLGWGMFVGGAGVWLPKWLLRQRMQGRHVLASLGKLERCLLWLSPRPGTNRPVSPRLIGALVAWTAFLLALPLPIPFNNILPAVGLMLLGMAVVERRPVLVGLGALFSVGGLLYFLLAGQVAWSALVRFL